MDLIKHNPNNNILRFAALIMLPSVMLCVAAVFRSFRVFLNPAPQQLHEFPDPSDDRGWMRSLLFLALAGALLLVAGNFYPYHKESMFFDNFHEGEALGPAIDYLKGRIPYRDTIFVHGPFQDPLRAVLAFAVFGKSIASVRTLEDIVQILNLFLFCGAIYILFGKNIYYTVLSFGALLIILFISPFHLSFMLVSRDIWLWLFIIVAALLNRLLKTIHESPAQPSSAKIRVLFLLFGLIPMLALVHSVDRGFFLLATSLLSFLLLYVCYFHEIDGKSILFHVFGYAIGLLILGFSIRWAYSDFFLYNVVIMPKYKGFMDAYPYPFERTRYILPILFMAAMIYFLTLRLAKTMIFSKSGIIRRLKFFYINYFVEITLVMISVFYYRSPLGRADIVHVKYVSAPLFVAAVYILVKHYLTPRLALPRRINYKFVGAGAMATIVLFMSLYVSEVNWKEFYRFPLGTPDEVVIPRKYRETAEFIRSEMGEHDSFFSMTNDASWYYLVDRPCPARFQIVWLAMPYFFQNEIIRDLEEKEVKYILYKNDGIWMSIDGFSNEKRLPILVKYIEDNYAFFKDINGNQIWTRKPRIKANRPGIS
jgi:hypothetical protein